MDLTAKNVLITHTIVRHIMGSTVVVLDVAEELQRRGATVSVYAASIEDPCAQYFRDKGLHLITGAGDDLQLADFDLVWVHSQVLPVGFIEQLGQAGDHTPAFVFNHMSALSYAPDEFAYIAGLEEKLSSLSLYVSAESQQAGEVMFTTPPPAAIFPNPAPPAFATLDLATPQTLRRACIVSNHVPDDLRDVAEALTTGGVEVVHWGAGGSRHGLLEADDLAEFDLMISIGKTVQDCLVAGRPVFVYDHFGGPGYLNADNFEAAAWHNFSGRGDFPVRSPEQLAAEIVDGYAQAVAFHQTQRDVFAARYAIDQVLPATLAHLQPRRLTPFSTQEVAVYSAAQRFGARFYQAWAERDLANEQRAAAVAEATALRTSWSYRLGQFIARPLATLHRRMTVPRTGSGSAD